MSQTVYVQSRDDGQPYSVNGAVAARGFEMLGASVHWFRRNELEHLSLEEESVVVGGVGTVHAALLRLGRSVPQALAIPPALLPHLGRRLWRTTLSQLRSDAAFPVFVKPDESHKRFDGRLLRSEADIDRLLRSSDGVDEGDESIGVVAQEVVSFASEWRVFVTSGVAQGVSHYGGDPLRFPSAEVIRMVLGAWSNAPAGYGADFGVLTDGRTVLVELNDGYSLGHGGLVADRYARLLRARWGELVGAL